MYEPTPWRAHTTKPDHHKRRLEDAMHVELEYGEKTWTTRQAVRDIFQNHLDAESDRVFARIIDMAFATDASWLKRWHDGTMPAREIQLINLFGGQLYRLMKYGTTMDPAARALLLDTANTYRQQGQLYYNWPTINLDQLVPKINSLAEQLPAVAVQVVDQLDPDAKPVWLPAEALMAPPWTEAMPNTETVPAGRKPAYYNLRYRINGLQISDHGEGFDAQLSTLFKPTKTGKIHQRGKFGEGLKMSFLQLVRDRVRIKLRSTYRVHATADQPAKLRTWQGRPTISESDNMVLSGVEVMGPAGGTPDMQTGSKTFFDLRTAYVRLEIGEMVDPRASGLNEQFLDYGNEPTYYSFYPDTPGPTGDAITGVGISPTRDPKHQYVHGVCIEGQRAKGSIEDSLLFSYDFLDTSALSGRDRSELNATMVNRSIIQAWDALDWNSPTGRQLVEELTKRCFLTPGAGQHSPERKKLALLATKDFTTVRSPFIEIMQTALELQAGNNVLYLASDLRGDTSELLLKAQNLNWHAVPIAQPIDDLDNLLKLLNAADGCPYKLLPLEELKNNPEQYGLDVDPKTLEVRQQAERVFLRAKTELMDLLRDHYGSGRAAICDQIGYRFIPPPTYPSHDKGARLEFSGQSRSFVILLDPVSMAADRIKIDNVYWKRFIQVLLLAGSEGAGPFATTEDAMRSAQSRIQALLDSLVVNGQEQHQAPAQFDLPPRLEWTVARDDRTDRLEQYHRLVEEWAFIRAAQSTTASFAELDQLAAQFHSLHPHYRNIAKQVLNHRVVIRQGTITHFHYNKKKQAYSRITRPLQRALDVNASKHTSIYKAGKRYVVKIDLPEGATIIDRDTRAARVTRQKQQLLDITTSETVLPSTAMTYDSVINFDDGCAWVEAAYSRQNDVGRLENFLFGTKIVEHNQPAEEMTMPEGIIESSLTPEYGKDAWDDPKRVLLDLIQNHIDAADARGIEIECEVLRAGERVFVPAELVTRNDRISGLKVRDYGVGYAPNKLGKLGASRKMNPLYAGKYGEGQKLLAAAARRHGLELTYSSVAPYNGKPRLWVAEGSAQPIKLVRGGRAVHDERLVFNLHSTDYADEIRSESTIRLTGERTAFWDGIEEIAHPKNQDELGRTGLKRIVRQLRPVDSEAGVVDMGFMHILLNEPGKVYENGLLIGEVKTACGYDLPSITSTRERNTVDYDRLRRYINYARTHCPDKHYIDRCVQTIERTLNTNRSSTKPEEVLLENNTKARDYYTLPLWDLALLRVMPGRFLHSAQGVEHCERNSSTLEERREYAAANYYARYLRPEERLEVSPQAFVTYAELLNTSRDFARRFSRTTIEVPDRVKAQLATVIAACAAEQTRLLSSISGRGKDKLFIKDGSRIPGNELWSAEAILARNGVRVAPREVGFHGIISLDAVPVIDINEDLLLNGATDRLLGTVHHELAHHFTQAHDFQPMFLTYMLELVFDAKRRQPAVD